MATSAQFLTRLKNLIDNGKCDIRQNGLTDTGVQDQAKEVPGWFIRVPGREGIKIVVSKNPCTLAVWTEDGHQRIAALDKNVEPIVTSIEAAIEGHTSAKGAAELNGLYEAMGKL